VGAADFEVGVWPTFCDEDWREEEVDEEMDNDDTLDGDEEGLVTGVLDEGELFNGEPELEDVGDFVEVAGCNTRHIA